MFLCLMCWGIEDMDNTALERTMIKEQEIKGVLCRYHKDTYTWISEDGNTVYNQYWKDGKQELRVPYLFDDDVTNERYIKKTAQGKVYVKDIVAQTWGPTEPENCLKCYLSHKDGNPQNDSAFNLQWVVTNPLTGKVQYTVDYQK